MKTADYLDRIGNSSKTGVFAKQGINYPMKSQETCWMRKRGYLPMKL
nr:hypothetical protein [Paenibacillus larvae]